MYVQGILGIVTHYSIYTLMYILRSSTAQWYEIEMQQAYNLWYYATDAQTGGLDDLKLETLHCWEISLSGGLATTAYKSVKGSPCQSFIVLSHPFLCRLRTLLKTFQNFFYFFMYFCYCCLWIWLHPQEYFTTKRAAVNWNEESLRRVWHQL